MVFFNCLITPAVLGGCTGLVRLELGRWFQPVTVVAVEASKEEMKPEVQTLSHTLTHTRSHFLQKLGGRRLSPLYIAQIRPPRGRPCCPGNTEGNTLVESAALKALFDPTGKHFTHSSKAVSAQ